MAVPILAAVKGEAIGFASYHSIYSTFLAKPGIWLDDLYLKPNFRGQGIGLFRILYADFAGLNEFSELSAWSHSPKMFVVNIYI